MSIEDYIINPREIKKCGAQRMFGDWMAEKPLEIEGEIRYETTILPDNWQKEYRLLDVTLHGEKIYKKQTIK